MNLRQKFVFQFLKFVYFWIGGELCEVVILFYFMIEIKLDCNGCYLFILFVLVFVFMIMRYI